MLPFFDTKILTKHKSLNILPINQIKMCHMKLLDVIRFKLFPSYRLKYGEKLWDEVNQKLPPAVGVIYDDEPRMKLFEELKLKMSKTEIEGLTLYLSFVLKELRTKFDEFATAREEAEEDRQKQIIREHLRVLTGSDDY